VGAVQEGGGEAHVAAVHVATAVGEAEQKLYRAWAVVGIHQSDFHPCRQQQQMLAGCKVSNGYVVQGCLSRGGRREA
jgi:hypothetical protein